MHRGSLMLLLALGAACAPQTPGPFAPRQSGDPARAGLAAPPSCREHTLRHFAPSMGSVRVVRHSHQNLPARAVVAYERLECGGLALDRCYEGANEHAQQRAFEMGLSARLLPVDPHGAGVDIAYVESEPRSHVVATADVEYEVPWGGRSQHRALETLYADLDAAGLELEPESDRKLRAVLAAPAESELAIVDAAEDSRLAVPSLPEPPRVFELELRCKPSVTPG